MCTPQSSFMSRPSFGPHRQNAFSLVEVALAVGIVGSALLVIFSLIPVGLSNLQDTGRQIVETEIYNKIGSELTTTAEYSAPPATINQTRTNLLMTYCSGTIPGSATPRFPAYFDAEGNELTPSATTGSGAPASAVFFVVCTYGDGSGNSKPSTTVWSPANSGELLSATVSIGYHQNPGTAPTPSANVRQRTFLLSNHGN